MQTAIVALTRAEVAGLLGWSETTFTRKYDELVRKHGFPLRMPGGTFYAPAVDRWMAARSGMLPVVSTDPLAGQRAHLQLITGGRA